jgi:hypothetical protein
LSIPIIENKGTVIKFLWEEEMLAATVSKLVQGKDGTLKGYLVFTTNNPEYHSHLLQQTYNFSSPRAQSVLKTDMSRRYKLEVDWDSVLEQLSVNTINTLNAGEAINEVWTDDKVLPLEYKLYPILPEGEPTIIFADGGSGKSSMGLYFTCCITLPWNDNPLGFKPKFGRVLYLDWETNINTFRRRISWVRRGHDLPEFAISYRRCRLPLSDDVEAIQRMIIDNQIDTIIIDSVIGACNGDINKNEVAADFYRALRTLNVTTLAIHHVSKEMLGKNRSPFGSAYFNNLARSVWELSKQQDPGDNTLSLLLSHYKGNDDIKHEPIGIEIEFKKSEGKTIYRKCNVDDIAEAQGKLSLWKRIESQLKSGALGIKDIVDILGASYQQTANTLTKKAKSGDAVKLPDGRWALPVKIPTNRVL